MTSLREFITDRLRELDAEERPLHEKLKALAEERAKLIAAATAAEIEIPKIAHIQRAVANANRALDAVSRRRTIPERTLKDAVIEVLQDKGRGMTALEILAAINLKFSTDYPRTSLSPQLSRLKAEGKLVREGIVWRLSDDESAAVALL